MNSLQVSTESNQGVTPNQRAQETVEERLRRLTKEAIGGGGHNHFGPKPAGPQTPHQGQNLGVPGPGASSDPNEIIHRIMRDATAPKR